MSKHFSIKELSKSQTALRLKIDNTPGPEETKNLECLAEAILEPVRAHYGKPYSPSSGYRSLALNRAIGSKDTSQHVKGEAVDFEVPGVSNIALACWVADNLDTDQVILEFYSPSDPKAGWVHVSYVEGKNRNIVLTIGMDGVQEGLPT